MAARESGFCLRVGATRAPAATSMCCRVVVGCFCKTFVLTCARACRNCRVKSLISCHNTILRRNQAFNRSRGRSRRSYNALTLPISKTVRLPGRSCGVPPRSPRGPSLIDEKHAPPPRRFCQRHPLCVSHIFIFTFGFREIFLN